MSVLIIILISAINFGLGFAAHWLNARGERRHEERIANLRRIGTGRSSSESGMISIGTDYEFWSRPDAMVRWREDCERARDEAKASGKTAMQEAFERIDAIAPKEIVSAVEMRAKRFRSSALYFYAQLDVIRAGLSARSWDKVERYLQALIEAASEQRWVGFGGETARINMTAMRIVAREYAAAGHLAAAE